MPLLVQSPQGQKVHANTRGIMRWARVFLVPWLAEESYFYSLHSEQARVVMPCTWNREAARGCQADGII